MSADSYPLTLGRVLIAAAWADGRLEAHERAALEDLLFAMPGIDGDTWRALSADIDRPFPPEHIDILVAELQQKWMDDAHAAEARETLEDLRSRLGTDTEEGVALSTALESLTASSEDGSPSETSRTGWFGRLQRSVGGGLREHATRVRSAFDREEQLERSLENRIREHWPADTPVPDESQVHRLALAAAILGHVIRLDDVVERGERDALQSALEGQWELDRPSALLVTELALDATAGGIDLHAMLRAFAAATTEDERERFLATVFRVAAGDGRASYDEIEEVRRIGRGLLLSHRHFIAAKLHLPEDLRDT